MRLGSDWPWVAAVAACACVALAVSAFGMGAGGFSVPAIAVALVMLAVGLVVSQVRAMQRTSAIESALRGVALAEARVIGVERQQHDIASSQSSFATQINSQMNTLRAEQRAMGESVQQGFAALRNSHETITASLRDLLDRPQPVYAPPPHASMKSAEDETDAADEAEEVEAEDVSTAEAEEVLTAMALDAQPMESGREANTPFGDALNLSLEPIVDLYTSQTAHYRLVLGMTNEQGQDVPHDVFIHHADRMNLRDQLDVFVAREALGILYQLRRRDPSLCVFVPIGAATLGSRGALDEILKALREDPTLSTGVVFDVPHAVLASLPDASLEGLARLARAGLTLSLSQASIAGIDLGALGKLNVRYVGLAAASVGLDSRVSQGLSGFVQAARALRIQVVISQVGDPHIVPQLSRVARYAAGPAFATPRRLRRKPAEQDQLSAAA